MRATAVSLLAILVLGCSGASDGLSIEEALFTITFDYEPYESLEAMAAASDVVVFAEFTGAFESSDPNHVQLRFDSAELDEPFDLDWHRPEGNSIDVIEAALRDTTGFVLYLAEGVDGKLQLTSPQGFVIGFPTGGARPYADEQVQGGTTLESWFPPDATRGLDDQTLIDALTGTRWLVTHVDTTPISVVLDEAGAALEDEPRLELGLEVLRTHDGCNRGEAETWTVDGGLISAPQWTSTQMDCVGIYGPSSIGSIFNEDILNGAITLDDDILQIGRVTLRRTQ